MKNPMNRRILRNIYKNIKAYIAIIIISLIAVLFYTGLEANYHYLENRCNNEISLSNLADNYITLNSYDTNDSYNLLNDMIYDKSSLSYKKNDLSYNVESCEKRFYCDAYYEEREIFLIAISVFNDMNVPAKITSGSFDKDSGVLVSEAFAKRRKIKIGDKIGFTIKAGFSDFYYDEELKNYLSERVKGGREDIYTANEFVITFTITGFMKHAEAVGKRASNPGLLYMSDVCLKSYLIKTLNDTYNLSDEDKVKATALINTASIYNQLLIRGGNLSRIREYFSSKEVNNMLLATPMEQIPTLSILLIDVENTRVFAYTFPIIFYVCAILIVIATIMKEIDNEMQNIGVFNALGIKRFRIAFHYSASTITSVLIGGIIGLLLGPIFIPLMMNLKYNNLYSLINVNSILYYPSYILIFLVLIIVGILTAIIRVYRYLRLTPKDAMDKRNASKRHILRFNFLPKRAYNLKMALRNIFWSPFKSILVIVGVLGCSALLIASFGVEDTIDYGVDLELNEKLSYDIDISYDHTYDIDSIMQDYPKSIKYYEKYQYSVVMAFNSDKLLDTTITVIDDDAKVINIDLKSDGCTITKKMAKSLGISEGDYISIYLKNKVYEIPVANVIDLFMSQTIYIPTSLYLEYDDVEYNRAFVVCEDDVDISLVNKKINKRKGIIFSRTKEQRRNTANEYLSLLKVVTNMIRIFAILLAMAVIYDLASLNYNERIRDVAQIKVLGYGYRKNMKTLLYEISILSIIGCALGMILGKPLMNNILELNENDMISFIPHINGLTYVITFCLTIGVSAILNLLLSIRINKLDMVKSIKGAE